MSPRRPRLSVTLAVLALALGPTRVGADDRELQAAEKTTRERVAELAAALPSESPGKMLATMAEQAGTDRRALAELYRAQDEYVARTMAEWRDGAERKALQDATLQLQRSAERASAELRATAEGTDSVAIQLRHSGVFGKVGRLEAATKDAGVRLAARWERERAMREREKEQREREAGERARDQRRN
jgi:hypothetical protein